jgi:hypothetical protein
MSREIDENNLKAFSSMESQVILYQYFLSFLSVIKIGIIKFLSLSYTTSNRTALLQKSNFNFMNGRLR